MQRRAAIRDRSVEIDVIRPLTVSIVIQAGRSKDGETDGKQHRVLMMQIDEEEAEASDDNMMVMDSQVN